MPTTTELETQRLHEAAEQSLATRMRALGRPADAYTTEEYLDAVEEVTAGVAVTGALANWGGDIDAAIQEGRDPGVVFPDDLHRRQAEILAERNLISWDAVDVADVRIEQVPRQERIDAMRQAIEEIGKPGEKRRDLEQVKSARKHELAVLGAKAGVLDAGNVAAWASRYDRDPAAATAELAASGVDVPGYTPPSPLRDPEYAKAAAPFIAKQGSGPTVLPDEFSVRLHAEAEELLASKGHRRSDGTFDYTAAQYADAVENVLKARTMTETNRLLEEQGLIVHGEKRYDDAAWSLAHDEAKAIVRRQVEGR